MHNTVVYINKGIEYLTATTFEVFGFGDLSHIKHETLITKSLSVIEKLYFVVTTKALTHLICSISDSLLTLYIRSRFPVSSLATRLRNDLYCVEWDVKHQYTIPYPGHRRWQR